MRSGALHRTVEWWVSKRVQSASGSVDEEWVKQKDIRAYIFQKKGRQTEVNQEVFNIVTIDVKVRNQHDIKEFDRIKYMGNFYSIEFMQLDNSWRFLMLRCERIND